MVYSVRVSYNQTFLRLTIDVRKINRRNYARAHYVGKHVASTTPYGYLKDPNDAKKIIINE